MNDKLYYVLLASIFVVGWGFQILNVEKPATSFAVQLQVPAVDSSGEAWATEASATLP